MLFPSFHARLTLCPPAANSDQKGKLLANLLLAGVVSGNPSRFGILACCPRHPEVRSS